MSQMWQICQDVKIACIIVGNLVDEWIIRGPLPWGTVHSLISIFGTNGAYFLICVIEVLQHDLSKKYSQIKGFTH